MQGAPKLRPSKQRLARRLWISVPFALATTAGILAVCLRDSGKANALEQNAKAELTRLGALVVMDAERKHVGSVNLSTLKSPETLERAIELLRPLTSLNSLNAAGTLFQDADVGVVGQLTNLEALVLSHTAITDSNLEDLQGLSRLKSIHLSDTGVTNACLPVLGRLRALTIIDLSGTKVTGNFEPLRDLANLNWLVVRRLSLDAAAVAAIGECPNLSRLTLSGTTCPPEALQKLAEKRPSLTIDQ